MPSDVFSYRITAHALLKARTFGMYGAIEDRIINMARMSAPFTHPVGNRRFHQFLLKIEGDQILDLVKFTPEEIALYDSPSYRHGDSQTPPASAEADRAPSQGGVLQKIAESSATPQRESYARQWALRNKKDDGK
jgi:hypothetical protein